MERKLKRELQPMDPQDLLVQNGSRLHLSHSLVSNPNEIHCIPANPVAAVFPEGAIARLHINSFPVYFLGLYNQEYPGGSLGGTYPHQPQSLDLLLCVSRG